MENKSSKKSGGFFTGLLCAAAGLAIGLIGKSVYDEVTTKDKEEEKMRQEHLRDIREQKKKDKRQNTDATEGDSITEDPFEYEAFFCPISQELMKDPVITPDGISYERESILKWLAKCDNCPITKKKLCKSNLITNYALKNTIDEYIDKIKKSK